jgi:hypothetical protein
MFYSSFIDGCATFDIGLFPFSAMVFGGAISLEDFLVFFSSFGSYNRKHINVF